MREPKLVVMRKGYDRNNANTRFRNIDTTKNTLKEFNTYSGTLTADAGNSYLDEVTITHNLGYHPLIMTWGGFAIGYGNFDLFQFNYITAATMASDPTDVSAYIEFVNTDSFKLIYTTAGFNGVPFESSIDYVCKVFVDPAREAWYE